MHCDLIQVYLEQKLAIEVLLHQPSYFQRLFKMLALPGIVPETAAWKTVTLPLCHSEGLLINSITIFSALSHEFN